tara:strand:+ start:150 stop:278 length:129 start_codon:yes stop_codon:yes gene_type:complete
LKDYMIKLGTYDGNIIEIPDIVIGFIGLVLLMIFFNLLSNNK